MANLNLSSTPFTGPFTGPFTDRYVLINRHQAPDCVYESFDLSLAVHELLSTLDSELSILLKHLTHLTHLTHHTGTNIHNVPTFDHLYIQQMGFVAQDYTYIGSSNPKRYPIKGCTYKYDTSTNSLVRYQGTNKVGATYEYQCTDHTIQGSIRIIHHSIQTKLRQFKDGINGLPQTKPNVSTNSASASTNRVVAAVANTVKSTTSVKGVASNFNLNNLNNQINQQRLVPLVPDDESVTNGLVDIPDNISIATDEGLDPEKLKEQIEQLTQLHEQEIARLAELEEQNKRDTENFTKYHDRLSDKQRFLRKDKEREEEKYNIFMADKRAYFMIKDDIYKEKFTEGEIPPMFVGKYPIFKFMDDNGLLNQDDEYNFYRESYDELCQSGGGDSKPSSYVPHNLHYLPEEEKVKYAKCIEVGSDSGSDAGCPSGDECEDTHNYPNMSKVLADLDHDSCSDNSEGSFLDGVTDFEAVEEPEAKSEADVDPVDPEVEVEVEPSDKVEDESEGEEDKAQIEALVEARKQENKSIVAKIATAIQGSAEPST